MTSSRLMSDQVKTDKILKLVKELRYRPTEEFMNFSLDEKLEELTLLAEDKEDFDEGVAELNAQIAEGVLDVGLCDPDDYPPFKLGDEFPRVGGKKPAKKVASAGSCFSSLCAFLGVKVPKSYHSVADLGPEQIKQIMFRSDVSVGCVVYGHDDPRNHVAPVKSAKSNSVSFEVLDKFDHVPSATYAITSVQDFFNGGGRYGRTKFYAEPVDMSDIVADDFEEAGPQVVQPPVVTPSAPAVVAQPARQRVVSAAEIPSRASEVPAAHQRVPSVASRSTYEQGGFGQDVRGFSGGANYPRPPPSVVDESLSAGSNNVSGGVKRAARRVVKGISAYDEQYTPKRNYNVSGVTMFNNVEEMYLNTISRDYAQEVIETFFTACGLPTDQPDSTQYAEDLLWAFIVARTASNKADYNVEYDVPVRGGVTSLDFAKFSSILADKYGLTRRNFARGVANDVRSYLRRPENQFVKTRSAQRVRADPQYGDLCFDGSTGCTNVTSSEMTFCGVLESRNLYERDDVIAEGASERLMQGMHGGVRSIVPR